MISSIPPPHVQATVTHGVLQSPDWCGWLAPVVDGLKPLRNRWPWTPRRDSQGPCRGNFLQEDKAMIQRFIIWLSRHYIESCEGCERLYWSNHGHETDDMVMLCLKCWLSCTEDSNRFDYEEMESA